MLSLADGCFRGERASEGGLAQTSACLKKVGRVFLDGTRSPVAISSRFGFGARTKLEKSRGARLRARLWLLASSASKGLQESFSSKLRPRQESPAPGPQTHSTRLQGSVPGKKGTESGRCTVVRDERQGQERSATLCALGPGPAARSDCASRGLI